MNFDLHSDQAEMKRKAGSSNEEPQPKRIGMQSEGYSTFSKRMMASMGYVPGKGLGKNETGIAEPISEASNKGRLGLGFMLEGLESEDVKWEDEDIHCDQTPEWMLTCKKALLTIDDFSNWISIGEKKESIEDETTFCDPDILERVLNAKTIFDNLSEKQFLDARTRSNPFETIKNAIFQNRAAMKMANMDAVFDFMFTNPKLEQVGSDMTELLYFADLCAGPGGFSEYVLWKKKWHAKGFGFTLKDPDSASDFKLDKFLSAPCESFDPHYGKGGYDGDGDITEPNNVEEFKNYVLTCTEGRGVHFVMADGGISVEGQENIQELLTKQLVLCQYMCALAILRKGGHFVCKVFDMYTPFSVGLFYLLYRSFERVCLFKPVTSRPANSERYIVCENLLQQDSAVQEYLFAVNDTLIQLHPQSDILSVVPESILDDEMMFTEYVTAYNDSFGVNQITHLKKLQYYVKNVNLLDNRQGDIRRKCLELWKVPISPRTVSPSMTHTQVFDSFWKEIRGDKELKVLYTKSFIEINKTNLNFMKDVHSWRWCWASGTRYMVVSIGRGDISVWDMKGGTPSFTVKRDLQGLELPKGTVIEIEVVNELQGTGSGQRKIVAAHVLDVIAIHGERLHSKSFKERTQLANKLCKAVNKPCRKGSTQLRAKCYHRVAELEKIFDGLKLQDCKGHPKAIPTHYINEEYFIAPVGVLFFKITKEPWHVHLGKNAGKFYYFNSKTKTSTFECPPNSLSSYLDVVLSRHIWIWKRSIFKDLCSEEKKLDSEEVNKSILCDHIQNCL